MGQKEPLAQDKISVMMSRRNFLGSAVETSFLGSIALYSASGLALITHPRSAFAENKNYRVLREVDVKFLSAILPAVISQADPAKDLKTHLHSFDLMLTPVATDTVRRIQSLVDLVTGFATRVPMTGTVTDWPDLSVANIEQILQSWRESSFELPVAAYSVMSQLTATAWYMVPEHQAASGYPGPPQKVVD